MAAPAASQAAPADPAFVAQWQKADRLIAGSDLLGAEKALAPLLPVAPSLDPGRERFWFAVSAQRILSAVGRGSEAARFGNEILAAGDEIRRPPSSFSPPSTASLPVGFCETGWPLTPGQYVGWEVNKLLGFGYLDAQTSGLPGDSFVGAKNDGGGLLIPSYFGGLLTFRASLRNGQTRRACNGLPVKGNGAPLVFVDVDYENRVPIAVPTSSRVIAKRRILLGGKFTAQVLAPDGTKITAWWTYPVRNKLAEGKRKLKTIGRVRGKQVTLRAPERKGQYVLKLTAGTTRKASTYVNGVGVGMKPYAFAETSGSVCTNSYCPPSGGGR